MRRALAVLLLLPLAACSGEDGPREVGGDDRVEVAVAAYPFRWLVEQVGGDAVRVVDVAQGAAEAHDVELPAKAVGAVRDADRVVVLRGFQPALDDAVEDLDDERVVQLADLVDLRSIGGDPDPHLWLDPRLMAQLARDLARELGTPAETAEAAATRLEALDAEFQRGLADCRRRDLVTAHEAFGYLAARYGLTQVGVAGLDPEEDPTPARVAEAVRTVRERNVTTVFFESEVSPEVARTVADEAGAKTALLETLESVSEGDDYPTVMRRNLQALRAALGCS